MPGEAAAPRAGPRTSADALGMATEEHFRAHATHFGLDADALDVTYVLNPGGFVNFSYRVSDGRTHLHAKLATTDEGQAALDRWRALEGLLRRHHAPPILAEIDLGAARGLVFPRLPGRAPPPAHDVVAAVVACARGLWADAELAERVATGRRVTAADCYRDTYHDRFTADLSALEATPPSFLAAPALAYLRAEAETLARRVAETPAFQDEVGSAIHGDLWLNNVLWESGDRWWLLDWDDMRIGDPALDLVTLAGPTAHDLDPRARIERVGEGAAPETRERLALLARAALLDWAIDPLADWLEATIAPTHQVEVRAEKERIHRAALALYRATYGRAG